MPCITDKLTREILAKNYVETGYNKSQACLKTGYSEAFANHGKGCKLFERKDVQEAVSAYIELKDEAEGIDSDYVMRKLTRGLRKAEAKNDIVGMARFTELIGKTMAMFKDKVVQEQDEERALSKRELEEAADYTKWKCLRGPELAQERA